MAFSIYYRSCLDMLLDQNHVLFGRTKICELQTKELNVAFNPVMRLHSFNIYSSCFFFCLFCFWLCFFFSRIFWGAKQKNQRKKKTPINLFGEFYSKRTEKLPHVGGKTSIVRSLFLYPRQRLHIRGKTSMVRSLFLYPR